MALSVDVLDACDGTAKGSLLLHAASVRQRLTFGRIGEFDENNLWFEGAPLPEVDTVSGLSTSVTTIIQCAIFLGSGGCDRGWRCR